MALTAGGVRTRARLKLTHPLGYPTHHPPPITHRHNHQDHQSRNNDTNPPRCFSVLPSWLLHKLEGVPTHPLPMSGEHKRAISFSIFFPRSTKGEEPNCMYYGAGTVAGGQNWHYTHLVFEVVYTELIVREGGGGGIATD